MMPSVTRATSQASRPRERRRLILDQVVTRRLVRELRRRGKAATALYDEGIHELKDGALFKKLVTLEPCVLVTWDNRMPFAHTQELEHHGTTVALLSREAYYLSSGYANEVTFIRDVVHRWAHLIELQPSGTVRRYSHRATSRALPPRVYATTTRAPR